MFSDFSHLCRTYLTRKINMFKIYVNTKFKNVRSVIFKFVFKTIA